MGNPIKQGLILFTLLFTTFPALSESALIKRLVIFGDSLSDQGKLFELYNERVPVSPPYWQGRFSNGPVWADILSKRYDIKNLSEGGATLVNYSKYSYALKYLYITHLGEEISHFLKNDHFLPTDLVIIWLGGNDYVTFDWVTQEDMQRAVRELYLEILRIRFKGAQQVLVINLPDISETPKVNGDDSEFFHQLTLDHNHLLEKTLQGRWPSEFLRVYDAFTTFKDILASPQDYGLQDITTPCYTGSIWRHRDEIPDQSDNTLQQGLQEKILPPNIVFPEHHFRNGIVCKQHLFFDNLHPTTVAHEIIAEKLDQFIKENYQPVLIVP